MQFLREMSDSSYFSEIILGIAANDLISLKGKQEWELNRNRERETEYLHGNLGEWEKEKAESKSWENKCEVLTPEALFRPELALLADPAAMTKFFLLEFNGSFLVECGPDRRIQQTLNQAVPICPSGPNYLCTSQSLQDLEVLLSSWCKQGAGAQTV